MQSINRNDYDALMSDWLDGNTLADVIKVVAVSIDSGYCTPQEGAASLIALASVARFDIALLLLSEEASNGMFCFPAIQAPYRIRLLHALLSQGMSLLCRNSSVMPDNTTKRSFNYCSIVSNLTANKSKTATN